MTGIIQEGKGNLVTAQGREELVHDNQKNDGDQGGQGGLVLERIQDILASDGQDDAQILSDRGGFVIHVFCFLYYRLISCEMGQTTAATAEVAATAPAASWLMQCTR